MTHKSIAAPMTGVAAVAAFGTIGAGVATLSSQQDRTVSPLLAPPLTRVFA